MRSQTPLNSQHPYHVSGRTPNREHFKLPMDETWQVMEEYLFLTKHAFNLRIHAFVLMPNHYHLLGSTPEANIGEAMRYFKGETSRAMNRVSGRINQNWGQRYYKTLVDNEHYFMNVYKYIFRNPVRAGLCEKVQDYPYSTLAGICGKSQLIIPVEEDTLLFDPTFNMQILNWLNMPSSPKDEAAVRNALRKKVFEFSKDQESGFASRLTKELI